jgi:hypothetical protein
MKSEYAIIHKNWNGIEIEIRWIADYVAFDDGQSMAHLEVERVKPAWREADAASRQLALF